MNAKKETIDAAAGLKLVKAASKLHAAKGKKVVSVDLKKDKPTDEELRKLVIGPSGNLRAPTLRVGKSVIVGFNEEMYEEFFG